jgi:hypothetical protein
MLPVMAQPMERVSALQTQSGDNFVSAHKRIDANVCINPRAFDALVQPAIGHGLCTSTAQQKLFKRLESIRPDQ